MQMLLVSMNDAFEAGRRIGTVPHGSAIDCPIGHEQIILRLSWMDGFSKGRSDPLRDRGWIDLPLWN
jgi:hypothetical protein